MNQNEVISQVYTTTDYNLFKTIEGNRLVSKTHVARLMKSFNSKYLLCPIIINEKFQIIDGQHRFNAARACELPVNYIVVNGYSLPEIQVYNTNMTNWKKSDFLSMYCDLGYDQYKRFKNFLELFPDFSINSAEIILTNKRQAVKEIVADKVINKKSFEAGELVIHDYDEAILNAERITKLKPYFKSYLSATFVKSMLAVFEVDGYDHDRFIMRMRLNSYMLEPRSTITQYRDLIHQVYNYKMPKAKKVELRRM